MNEKKLKTDVAHGATEEQLVNGKSVVDQTCLYVKKLLSLVEDKVSPEIRYTLSYTAAKEAGVKVVFLEGNRKINWSHVNALWKSVQGVGKFIEACYVVPLRPILEAYPTVQAFDSQGSPLSLTSQDVDLCVALYDGQHRVTVCESHPDEVDVNLDLYDFDGTEPLDFIKKKNSLSRNWDGTDFRHSNVNSGKTNNRLYEEASKLCICYNITEKLAEYILTFIRDATKKKDLVAGKDTTTYNDDNGERGKAIFTAAITNFNNANEVKKLPFMDAVVKTYNDISDLDKPGFRQYMKLYLGTMEDEDRSQVLSFIKEKNFGQLDEFIKKGYKAFIKKHNDKNLIRSMESKLDSKIKSFIDDLEKRNQEKFEKNELKSGRVHEILEQHRKVVDKRKEDAKQKAKDKRDRAKVAAEKAQEKATQASIDFESLQDVNSDND